eukprot:m.30523 g.30523  ORF g.30523 m.30523 type:complete len:442 (+) comp6235_c0_seq1:141-1466(+)
MEALAEKVRAHVESLAAFNIPSKMASTEPNEVKVAYDAGLKMVHQKTGAEVCEMLGVDPRRGLNVSYALQRLSKYGENTINPVEVKLYGSKPACEHRATRAYAILRGDDVIAVRTKDIVVGDAIYLEAGDHVPADIRILKASKNSEEKFEFNPSQGAFEKFAEDVGTIIDGTLPGGFGVRAVVSGSSTQSSLEQANNVALKGSTILSGSLLGVVFGTGARVCLASINPTSFLKDPRRLPRGVDKKKLAKVVAKLGTLGANVKQADRVVPFCGARRIAVAFAINPTNIDAANKMIKRMVALSFPVFVFVNPTVDPTKSLQQIESISVGKPFDIEHVHTIVDDASSKDCIKLMENESVVLGTGPPIALEHVVKNITEVLGFPVAVFGSDGGETMAMEAGTISFCSFNSPPSVLAASDVICGRHGLERLALYLKLLKESTEISN